MHIASQPERGAGFTEDELAGSCDADIHSDCDFLVVAAGQVNPGAEQVLRHFHHALPKRDGHWNKHMEGSYAPVDDLRSISTLRTARWLYIDHGQDTMEWSAHCNTEPHRWTLRERGVTLVGPAPSSFACEIPGDVLRDRMRADIPNFIPELFSWIDLSSGWAQRYAVATLCRMLHTLHTGAVCSKRTALEWALRELEGRWSELLEQVRDDRVRGLDFDDPPRPGSVEQTLQFAGYAKEVAARS